MRSWISFAALVLLASAGSAPAGALSFPLTVEFDGPLSGSFGTVDVTESGGDLAFSITLAPSLGIGRDLHELYFNLTEGLAGVAISSTDVVATPYTLAADPSVAGGAGAAFDFGVNFGDGAGPPGNGQRTSATFVLSADSPLSIADLLIESSTSQGIDVVFAAHVQGTSLTGADSETVGAPIPEPATALLLALGLAALGRASRRVSGRAR
jgi:hypothetical protein